MSYRVTEPVAWYPDPGCCGTKVLLTVPHGPGPPVAVDGQRLLCLSEGRRPAGRTER